MVTENHLVIFRVWAVVVFLTLVASGYMFTSNVLNYLYSTTRTTLETSTASIAEVVFPSVTVCNMVQVVSSFTLRVCKKPSPDFGAPHGIFWLLYN